MKIKVFFSGYMSYYWLIDLSSVNVTSPSPSLSPPSSTLTYSLHGAGYYLKS